MTSSKRSARRRRSCSRPRRHASRVARLIALLMLAWLIAPRAAEAQGIRQYQRSFSAGGRLPSTIILVGYDKDAADIIVERGLKLLSELQKGTATQAS